MSTYIWCEDSASGFAFWRFIFETDGSDVRVESKGNNSRLRRAVSELTDRENEYYILVDNAVDNPDVLRELKRIKKDISGHSNMHILNIHSFEFTLLSFERLEEWVFAENDPFREKRAQLLRAREIFTDLILNGSTGSDLAEFKACFAYPDSRNTEQISARLLFEITRNTGFETDKGRLGECFVKSCCELAERQEDDICGLDGKRLSADEKRRQLTDGSVLKTALTEAGFYDNGI